MKGDVHLRKNGRASGRAGGCPDWFEASLPLHLQGPDEAYLFSYAVP
ncbi:hypothetical protein DEDE109153_08165 [Deinococcus deserti]